MSALKRIVKKYASHLLYRRQLQRQTYLDLLDRVSKASGFPLSSASDDIFTYHGEDGIIQFILQHLDVPPIFVDIGSGDCIKSNCAVLAVHQNWKGVFIDIDREQLDIGYRFYKGLEKRGLSFRESYVSPSNVNSLIKEQGYDGKIGLLSIDLDGNDYWIWNALEVIQPCVVVAEAKVEFGLRNIVVPYSHTNNQHFHSEYYGASVEALRNLGLQKGYTLVGANSYGYNLFFISNNLVKSPFVPVEAALILKDPETQKCFYPESFFRAHQFITP